jgi:hypothetical protein
MDLRQAGDDSTCAQRQLDGFTMVAAGCAIAVPPDPRAGQHNNATLLISRYMTNSYNKDYVKYEKHRKTELLCQLTALSKADSSALACGVHR